MVDVLNDIFGFLGDLGILAARSLRYLFTGRFHPGLIVLQMARLGVAAAPIVVLVNGFVGAALAYLILHYLSEYGLVSLTGGLILMVFMDEIGPLLVAIVGAGKISATIASEIGSMKISEQIDALKALSTDPDWYLTLPRVVAVLLMIPFLGAIGIFSGYYGGYIMANLRFEMTWDQYGIMVQDIIMWREFRIALIKLLVFGLVISLVGCRQGFDARGGSEGVGRTVTNAVTYAILIIFALDLALIPVLFE